MNNGNDHPGPFGSLLVQLMTDDALLAKLSTDPSAVTKQFPGVSPAQIALLNGGSANAIETEFRKENPAALTWLPPHVRLFTSNIKKRFRRART